MSRLGRAASFLVLGTAIPCVIARNAQPVLAAGPSTVVIPQRFLALLVHPVPAGAAFQAAAPKKTGDIPLPEGKGRDTAKKLCGSCHSTNVWASQKHTSDEWSSIVDSMVDKGLDAPESDLALVSAYLSANFAPPKAAPSTDTPPPTPPPSR